MAAQHLWAMAAPVVGVRPAPYCPYDYVASHPRTTGSTSSPSRR